MHGGEVEAFIKRKEILTFESHSQCCSPSLVLHGRGYVLYIEHVESIVQ
jgi:hypothetical protein